MELLLEYAPFQFLQEITNGFSEKREVGKGSFAVVYRGVTRNGDDVAVKKLNNIDLDYKKFQNEIYNMWKLKHQNIVEVLGYCYEIERKPCIIPDGSSGFAEETHRAICLEYLHNGSLQKHLSDELIGLDWHTRFKIIKGTCEGLKYIHLELEEPMYHLDLKPDNILLDKDMVPKIADFGLSRICKELSRTTTNPYGTDGYKPPEYIDRGEISAKFDIFSLGVIMLRIILGHDGYHKCFNVALDKFIIHQVRNDEYIEQVQQNWRNRLQTTCGSYSLLEASCHQVETCTKIALDCVEKDSQKRPNIGEITEKLNEIETGIGKQFPQEGCHKIVSRMTMNNKKIEMTKESQDITVRHQNINLMAGPSSSDHDFVDPRETYSDVVKECIIGRTEETKKIVAFLEGISEKIVILPIYGIGGIGKTTFARLIYNDPEFKDYSHVWIHVSQRFELNEICSSIISQLPGVETHANERQMISSRLTELLYGKKIMIVLDDLWEDDPLKLEELKDMLYNDNSTIVVLVTTRSEHVAEKTCRNIRPYKILPLTTEMCWDIIKQRSNFEVRNDREQLTGIGREVAEKCGGVALAAQTIGFTLRSMNFDGWMKVKNNIWNDPVSKDDSSPDHVLASLKLSYSQMALCLKKCFTYCAIFPKGHKIIKEDLMYQWISLDFIKPTKLFSNMQLCEKYIVQLLGISFFQHSVSPKIRRSSGVPSKLKMHDLVHDLAKLVAEDELVTINQEDMICASYSPRYAMVFACKLENLHNNKLLAGLRALHIKDSDGLKFEWYNSSFVKCLRVLDISGQCTEKLPSSIGKMKQLRYLNASEIQCEVLPKDIDTLSELQYLNLRGSRISALPDSVTKLGQLMHLDISDCVLLQTLPNSFCNLRRLCFLSLRNCCQLSSLPDDLSRLKSLEKLNLSGCSCLHTLPESLGGLDSLEQLDVSGCKKLTMLPKSFIYLTGLQYLNISSCSELDIPVDALNNLTNLNYIDMSSCPKLLVLPQEFSSLKHLHTLILSECSKLANLPKELGQKESIKFILLDGCTESVRKTILQYRLGAGLQSLPAFVVETQVVSTRSNISQLEQEKFSELELYRLEHIRTVDEAKALNMPGRSGLRSLGLKWTLNAERFVEDEALLQALEPHKSLNKFRVQGYKGERFPEWKLELGSSSRDQLHEVGLMHFPMCNSLPQLGQLTNLDKLHLCRMPKIRTLGRELSSNTGGLRNLQIFTLEYMENLEEWCTTISAATGQPKQEGFMFPALQVLNIYHCPLLTMNPFPPTSINWEVRASSGSAQVLLQKDEVMQSLADYMGLQCPFAYTTELHLSGSSSSSPDLPTDRWKFNGSLITLNNLTGDCCSLIDKLLAKGNNMQCLVNLEISGVEGTNSFLEEVESVAYYPRSSLAKLFPDFFSQQPGINRASPHFIVTGYACCGLDGWIDKVTSFLGNLIRINMEDLPMCDRLPPLGQLSRLQQLRLKGMPKIRSIDRDFCGSESDHSSQALFFPRLTRFVLNDMPNLEEWVTTVSGRSNLSGQEEFMFPKLEKLTIWNCPKLKLKPCLPRAEEWDINNSDQVIASTYDINSGGDRKISFGSQGGDDINSGGDPKIMLQVLLCKVPPNSWKLLHHLRGIQSLAILSCHGMEALPESIQCHLSSLRSLTVSKCHGLKHLPEWLGDLTSLKRLMVVSCPLEFLPGSMRRLSSLRSLTLSLCDKLAALPGWMGDLKSLVKITIEECRSLKSLPQLYQLEHLLIQYNDELERWCKSEVNQHKFPQTIRKDFFLESPMGTDHYILPARSLHIIWANDDRYWRLNSIPESRIALSMELIEVWWLVIEGYIPTEFLSTGASYDIYLVYKLAKDHDGLRWGDAYVEVDGVHNNDAIVSFVDEDALRVDRVAYPVTRSEGWMELWLGEFDNKHGDSKVKVSVSETTNTYAKVGLIIEGMELRMKT